MCSGRPHHRRAGHLLGVSCIATLLIASISPAAEPPAAAVLGTLGGRKGLVVLVGATDGDLAKALVKTEPLLVYALAPDAATEAKLRQAFVAAGIHGQVTAGCIGTDGSLPLNDDVAAMAVADLDANKNLKREEILRIVHPLGLVHFLQNGKWQTENKPRPADVDDWPQYFHDASMSDLSTDKRSGAARGLQWEVGPQTVHSNGVRVVGDIVVGQDEQGLWARDAFSGLPCWRRNDLKAATRYSLLADAERVYIYPAGQGGYPPTPSACQVALDLRTGETLLKYTEGLTFEVPSKEKKDPKTAKEEHQAIYDRSKDFQARLLDGLLIQVSGPGLAVLDAKTGKRAWNSDAPGNSAWAHPLAAGNTLYVVQGQSAPSASYTHWPMTLVQKVMAFELKTGKTQWVWEWQKEMPAVYAAQDASVGDAKVNRDVKLAPAADRVAAAYNMALDGNRLVFALRAETVTTWKGAGLVRQLVLDAKSGKFLAYGKTPGDGGGGNIQMGGGHSHFRVLPVNGRWWFPDAIGIYGHTDPAAPADASKFQLTYARLPRPVGCTVFRASPNFLFGSLTTYALDGSGIQHTNVARTACDVGAFPANGMTYITPNQCFCQPYLPGHNVFHPRPPKPSDDAGRLERGTATPAAALPAADDEWPMYLRDNLRSSWTGAGIPAALRQAWTIRPAEPLAGLIGQDWANQWHGQGPVTGLSVAEGIGALALTDRQQAITLDPATGKTKWHAAVDGRIDSQPTIFNGAVYVGTRAGWLYAFNRDSGDLIWRFRAAPRRERIVVSGQLESVWPLFGTVTADSEGVWAVAGRHNECDGGMWWWRLDPATGAVRASGRFGRDELRTTTGATGAVDSDAAWPNGANCPPVTDGKLFLMARVHCKREDGKLMPWNYWSSAQKPGEQGLWESNYNAGILMPGNQGLLNRIDFLGGYKMCAFGYVQARQFAYRGADFLTVGGTKGTLQHRGGDGGSSVHAFRRRPALGEITVTNPKEPDKPRKATTGSELRWENPMEIARRGDGTKALAVAGESVLVGVSVTDGDRWKEREKMPHRLQVLSLADGKLQQEFPLPASPIPGGLSAAKGRVYVTAIDGSVTCFEGAK